MRNLYFVVPLSPVAKQRARHTKSGHSYTPKKTVDYENAVAIKARESFNSAGLEGEFSKPIELTLDFYLQRPKRLDPDKFKRKKINPEPIPHDKKPDLDNLIKAVKDGINKSGIWTDDKLVWSVKARKRYVGHKYLPSVTVSIKEVEQESVLKEHKEPRKYEVYGTVTGGKYIGTFEARSKREAEEKAWESGEACVLSNEVYDPEIHELEVFEVKDNA